MKRFKPLVILLPILALAGCSDDQPNFVDLNLKYVTTANTPSNVADTSAQSQLARAAQSVDQSLQQMSAISLATHPGIKMPTPTQPAGMTKRTSIDWTGPIKPLLEKIAHQSGYTLHVLGNPPAIPVIVSINAKAQPIASILRNATYQAAMKARIAVFPKTKTIELRYLSN